METFFGHDVVYWIELERRLKSEVFNGPKLLAEIVYLRGLVDFYENRVKEMSNVRRKD